MGWYISIKGWIECDFELLEDIRNIIEKYKTKKEWAINDEEQKRLALYQTGWRLPTVQNSFNWTLYVFYGADIRREYYDYIKEQIELIAKLDEKIEGFFMCSDEESEGDDEWRINNGLVTIQKYKK